MDTLKASSYVDVFFRKCNLGRLALITGKHRILANNKFGLYLRKKTILRIVLLIKLFIKKVNNCLDFVFGVYILLPFKSCCS